MTKRLGHIGRWSWRLGLSVAGGLALAGGITGAFALTLHYVAPARNDSENSTVLRPIVESGWIKMPFDIVRDKECLANSTITLRREHDYGPPLGMREDTVTLGLYNTTITRVGMTRSMLWFAVPPALAPGEWSYDSKTQDDCGGIGDLLNFALHRPRITSVPAVLTIPEARQ